MEEFIKENGQESQSLHSNPPRQQKRGVDLSVFSDSPSSNMHPSNSTLFSRNKNFVTRLPFLLFLSLSFACLAFSSIQFGLEQKKLSEVQLFIDSHSDQLYLRGEAQKNYHHVDHIYTQMLKDSVAKGKIIDWKTSRNKRVKDGRTQAKLKLLQFDDLPETSPFLPQKEAIETKLVAHLKLAHWLALSLLLPLLFAFPHFYKASRMKSTSPSARFCLSVLLLLPVIQTFGYLYYSATWNLDGAQRKNAFIYTLPLAIATLVCSYLIYHHYALHPQYSLYSLGFVAILWGILHYRFLQMVNYYYSHQQQLSY